MDDKLWLHRARIERGVELGAIASATALSPQVISRLDEGRFEELPSGVYARAYVRAFATAVGVSPVEALQSVEPLLPCAPDPLPALRELAPPSAAESIRTFLALQANPLGGVWRAAVASGRSFHVRRVAAATVDALLLLGIGTVMVATAAWACGVTVEGLLQQAGTELALLFAVPVGLYFILFEALAGGTLGGRIFGHRKPLRIVFRITTLSPRSPSRQIVAYGKH